MSRTGRRLIKDFIVPALDDQRYGKLLRWTNKEKGIFCIGWSHKNASNWQHHDTIVFQDWDKMKGHYRPEKKGYFMAAKQRFRAALYKLPTVVKLNPKDRTINMYQLVDPKKVAEKKEPEVTMGRPKKAAKRENRKSIPTSVIRKNTSYIAKSAECSKTAPPSPPPVSSSRGNKSKMELEKSELKKCYDEYMNAQSRQIMLNNAVKEALDNEREEISPTCKTYDFSMLQENSITQEIPTVSKQTIPVNYPRQPDVSQKRLESPLVFIVNTHHECASKIQDDVMDYILHADSQSYSGGALNLSVKSDDSDTLSR